MYKVTFLFEDSHNALIETSGGETVLELAKKANVAIDAPCSGNGSCGKCRVKVGSGKVESQRTRHISADEYAEGIRLACQSVPLSDVEIKVPDIASAYQSRMKIADLSSYAEVRIFNQIWKAVEKAGISFENSFSVVPLRVNAPSFEDTMPDNERVIRALKKQTGCGDARLTYYALKKMPGVLRNSGFDVKLAVKKTDDSLTVLDVFPGNCDPKLYSLVVDIGTTSVSAVIANLADGIIVSKASNGNAQIRYGADVINRIIESAKSGGREKLQDAVIADTINPMIDFMCRDAEIDPDNIYSMCVACNTTMNHLFAGVSADYLRQEPFVPAFFRENLLQGIDLEVKINPYAEIVIAPNIGSYVGGDITAGTLASMIWNKPEFSLFVDLGTNGEIVFGNSDFLMACACSAGPAFEGGDISCGMRATDGAIESLRINKETMNPSFSVIGGGSPVGVCGSGLIDLISELYANGIINSKGKFIREGERVRSDEYGICRYVVAFKGESAMHRDIEINEIDINNFIRAKGAIFSAIKTMLGSLDMDVSVIESVYVAGGIGSGINIRSAINIGMLPDIPPDKYSYIGNSSLTGAYCMAMSEASARKIDELSRAMTYMELSNIAGYMDEFVAACFIPHTDEKLFASAKTQQR